MHSLDSITQLVAYETANTKKLQSLHKRLQPTFICKKNIMIHFQSGVRIKKWNTFKIKMYASSSILG
jgi:hypothetical protein